MRKSVEQLHELYLKCAISKEKIDALYVAKKITKAEYEYILGESK